MLERSLLRRGSSRNWGAPESQDEKTSETLNRINTKGRTSVKKKEVLESVQNLVAQELSLREKKMDNSSLRAFRGFAPGGAPLQCTTRSSEARVMPHRVCWL